MDGIINGEKTIIISKQAFADKAVKCMEMSIHRYGPYIGPLLASVMSILTHELFEEETIDEGFNED